MQVSKHASFPLNHVNKHWRPRKLCQIAQVPGFTLPPSTGSSAYKKNYVYHRCFDVVVDI